MDELKQSKTLVSPGPKYYGPFNGRGKIDRNVCQDACRPSSCLRETAHSGALWGAGKGAAGRMSTRLGLGSPRRLQAVSIISVAWETALAAYLDLSIVNRRDCGRAPRGVAAGLLARSASRCKDRWYEFRSGFRRAPTES